MNEKLETKTLDELKVLAYDISVQVNLWQGKLGEVNQAIQAKQFPPPIQAKAAKKKG